MQENGRGNKMKQEKKLKGLQAKKEKYEKIKQNINNAKIPNREMDLKDVYTEEANKEYLKRMIEEDEKEIRLYEKKLGLKKKDSNKGKRFFKDLMRDDDENELFDFLDDITKKVHGEKVIDYSGREKRNENELYKDLIEARNTQKDLPSSEENDSRDEEIEDSEIEEENGTGDGEFVWEEGEENDQEIDFDGIDEEEIGSDEDENFEEEEEEDENQGISNQRNDNQIEEEEKQQDEGKLFFFSFSFQCFRNFKK